MLLRGIKEQLPVTRASAGRMLGLSSNPILLVGIGVEVALLLLLIYTPAFQSVFELLPLALAAAGCVRPAVARSGGYPQGAGQPSKLNEGYLCLLNGFM
ncbi:MAG: cation transporting ATPase C-terminal domain-containing protein [Acidobacteriota bacterium]